MREMTYTTNGSGAPILDTDEKRRVAKRWLTRKECPTCGAKRGSRCESFPADRSWAAKDTVCMGRLEHGEAPVVEALEAAGYRLRRTR